MRQGAGDGQIDVEDAVQEGQNLNLNVMSAFNGSFGNTRSFEANSAVGV